MCGRTALTLAKDDLVRKCVFKKVDKEKATNHSNQHNSGSGHANNRLGNINDEDEKMNGTDHESNIVPVWREAPCEGQYSPSPNIAPTVYTPILFMSPSGQVTLQPMMWGLVPPWHQGPGPKTHGLSTNNCRLEGVMSSKLYSPSLASRRCVVVCEGFYEWLRQSGDKQPYLVSRPGDGDEKPLMYMAGLYSVWQEKVFSYTILTRESNGVLSWLHHRMPAFLDTSQVTSWLDPDTDVSSAMAMLDLGMPGEGDLVWHKVTKMVGNSRNQDLDLMKELEEKKEEPRKMNGVMANWLNKSKTVNSPLMSKNTAANIVKKEDKSKSLMNNWLKRSSTDDDGTVKKMKKDQD